MVMEFSTALIWLQGILFGTLLLVIAGLALKHLGVVDSLWGVLSKFVDWVIWLFHTVTNVAPAFVKVGFFLILFSLVGAFIVPLTIGVYGACDSQGDLWRTDDFFEGFAVQTLPGGILESANVSPLRIGSEELAGFMNSEGIVASLEDRGIVGVAGDSTPYYYVCYDNEDGVCKAKRGAHVPGTLRTVLTSAFGGAPGCTAVMEFGSVVSGDYVTLLHYWYDLDGPNADGSYSVGAQRVVLKKGVLGNGGLNDWDSIADCTLQTSNTIPIVVFESGHWEGFSFVAGRNITGYVEGIVSSEGADVGDLNQQRFSALSVKDSFLEREGSGFTEMKYGDNSGYLIQYACDSEGDKEVTLQGLPIFDIQFVLVLVIVLGIVWFLVKR